MSMFFEFINGPMQKDDPYQLCIGMAVIFYCMGQYTVVCVPETPIAGCDFAPVISVGCTDTLNHYVRP